MDSSKLKISSSSKFIDAKAAEISSLSNKEVVIKHAFPNGYPGEVPISFTVSGVTNPSSTKPTPSLAIKLYYIKNNAAELIDVYTSNELVVTAAPSQQIPMTAALSSDATGQLSDFLSITGQTPEGKQIAKESTVEIHIPNQFYIPNLQRTQSSCSRKEGFSDEISCVLRKVTDGFTLTVLNGFNSQIFSGGAFTLQISEVMNPNTTQATDFFGI